MARRRKGRAVSGWLCLDKRVGQTSTAAVGAVKRLFDAYQIDMVATLEAADAEQAVARAGSLRQRALTVPGVPAGRRADAARALLERIVPR